MSSERTRTETKTVECSQWTENQCIDLNVITSGHFSSCMPRSSSANRGTPVCTRGAGPFSLTCPSLCSSVIICSGGSLNPQEHIFRMHVQLHVHSATERGDANENHFPPWAHRALPRNRRQSSDALRCALQVCSPKWCMFTRK